MTTLVPTAPTAALVVLLSLAPPLSLVAQEASSAADRLLALVPLLASADSHERDDVAYGTAERLIIREQAVPPEGLRRVMAAWLAGLDDRIGEQGTDSVFRRSFSALCLSLVAAQDLRAPFLTQAEFDRLLDRTLAYAAAERDLRGFDPVTGWMHSVAHTADLLKFLGRNPKLAPAAQTRIVEAIAAKVEQADTVFVWGEAERIAAALRSLVVRPDAQLDALGRWIAAWPDRHAALWADGPRIDPDRFARVQNARQILAALAVSLPAEAGTPEPVTRIRTALVDALARMR
ncbi:MAG: DUF2785 domain-containing protein [Vicinamibacterales bacterium]